MYFGQRSMENHHHHHHHNNNNSSSSSNNNNINSINSSGSNSQHHHGGGLDVDVQHLMGGDDGGLFGGLGALTRKRKVSKMWNESMSSGIVAGPATDANTYYSQLQLFGIGHSSRAHDENNRQPHKEQRKDSTAKMTGSWRVDDIDAGLAADFDDSLSGLGVEVSLTAYNMSETLLALPPVGPLPTFKQEATENGCRQAQTTSPPTPTVNSHAISSHLSAPHLLHGGVGAGVYGVAATVLAQNRFQYVLGAATSIATKMNEETLTYLNQGQSYEIKLKKLGDITDVRGKMMKSVIRVCFHERRLQYMEREQISNWRQMRPGERILEIDLPLSYGVCDIVQDQYELNTSEFVWDPTKETGVFVRINCISTEFTPKKHGGEKGVPFRIQIETFSDGDGVGQRLHSASCQIKVFKPKGADRKHKTDREKMAKKPLSEQETFQPSYDCTVLTEGALDAMYISPIAASVTNSPKKRSDSLQFSSSPDQPPATPSSMTADSPVGDQTNDSIDNPVFGFMQFHQETLAPDASASNVAQWLQANRFSQYARTFASFSAADILRLSRDDLIQICGLADGIRLYNALHPKAIRPRLTLYVCLELGQVYNAVYLDSVNVDELRGKLAILLNIQLQQIHDIIILGPNGIHVMVTDEVIQNLNEESMFLIELRKDASTELYSLLLKSAPLH